MGPSRRGRRGQPGRPSAGLSASGEICVVPHSRTALTVYSPARPGPVTGATSCRDDGVVLHAPAPASIPDVPGVYVFRDPSSTPLYVGKARSLRARLSSYFADGLTLPERTAHLVGNAASVDWTVT